jgi:hypothetical protein
MKRRIGFLLAALLGPAVASPPARAHFKLLAPPEWITVDGFGDPQKEGPCGTAAGTRSNMVTRVQAGAKLKLQWQETIGHPGHFRIAIAANRADLMGPDPVVVANDCKSAAIQNPPVAPIIADGLFPRSVGMTGQMYEYEITVPNMVCDRCTLQVVQFMSQHPPSCFYYHCADLQITAAGAASDGGAGGTSGSGASGAGGSGSGGVAPPTSPGGGCLAVAGARPASGPAALAVALLLLSLLRRRRG